MSVAAFLPHTTPPSVSWISPSPNATVSSTITLTASSTDNVAVQSIALSEGPLGGTLASSTPIGTSTSTASGTIVYSIPWTTTSTANGSTTLWALSTDTSNNTSTASTTVNVANPPTIYGISTSTTINTATITWTTNEGASSQVNYGLTSSYGSSTATTTLVTSHSITLIGLATSTIYHYKILSTDAQSNTATTTDATLTTKGPVTYYVDFVSGSDANAGTSTSTPWQHRRGIPTLREFRPAQLSAVVTPLYSKAASPKFFRRRELLSSEEPRRIQ